MTICVLLLIYVMEHALNFVLDLKGDNVLSLKLVLFFKVTETSLSEQLEG